MNIAVIGMGFMGRTHSLCASMLPFYYDVDYKLCLHTLCGRDIEKTRKQAERYGFKYAVTDFESVVNNPEIDVIDVCTPNMLHYEQVKSAILHKKAVYCDKPLSVSYEKCRELTDLATENGVICAVTFQNRFWNAVQYAKTLDIGDVMTFRGVFLHSSLTNPEKPYAWRNSPISEGGGVLNDLGSHLIDLVQYLAGEIDTVHAEFETYYKERKSGDTSVKIESDDAVFMTATLKNGAHGTLEASKLAVGVSDKLCVEVHGTNGGFKWDLAEPNELHYFDGKAWQKIECMQKYPSPCDFLTGDNKAGWVRAHLHSYYDFTNAVAHKAQPLSTFENATSVQRIIDLCRK